MVLFFGGLVYGRLSWFYQMDMVPLIVLLRAHGSLDGFLKEIWFYRGEMFY